MYKIILSAVTALALGVGTAAELAVSSTNSSAAAEEDFLAAYPMYSEKLEEIKTAKNTFTSTKEFINNELSPLYLSTSKEELGWYLCDFFGDENPELLIIGGDIHGNDIYTPPEGTKCIIEVYTIYGGYPAAIIQSTDDYEYFICKDNMIGLITNKQNEYGLDYYNPDGSTADAVSYIVDDGTKTWLKRNKDDITNSEITEEEALELIGRYISEFSPVFYNPNSIYYSLLGDADGSGAVDASDASFALREYAAVSTGSESVMKDVQKNAADVNGDGAVDAVDASTILGFYSYISTGGEIGDMREWLKQL